MHLLKNICLQINFFLIILDYILSLKLNKYIYVYLTILFGFKNK